MFQLGSQCGLKPDEVLDFSNETLKAYVAGCRDRDFTQQLIAVQTGYWCAYYTNAKHAKPPATIIAGMIKQHEMSQSSTGSSDSHSGAINVDAFLELEASFNKRMEEQKCQKTQSQ